MKKLILSILFLFVISSVAYAGAIVIDHTCTDVSEIPQYWIDYVQDNITVHHAGASHGEQLPLGMELLETEDSTYAVAVRKATTEGLPDQEDPTVVRIYNGQPPETSPDVHPGDYWEGSAGITRTEAVLDTENYGISYYIWCWEGHNYTSSQITEYCEQMSSFASDYPDITMVLVTAHLPPSKTGETPMANANRLILRANNEQIRTYAEANDMYLLDWADIDSYEDDQETGPCLTNKLHANYLDYPVECDADSETGTCGHSVEERCILKGNAMWWLFARIAGWNGLSAGTCGSSGDGSGTTHCTGASPWLADSCSDDDAEYCVETCASDGETVNLPAGNETWTLSVDIVDKNVAIIGTGQSSTNITYSGANAYDAGAFHIDNDAGSPKDDFEIAYMSITEGMGDRDTGSLIANVWDAGPDWRIHHITATSAYAGNMVYVGRYQGSNSGLIDNCIFNASTDGKSTKMLQVNAKDMDTETDGGAPSVSHGSTSWAAASTFGTKEALYIEDNVFNWNDYTGMDFDEGARVVIRYNDFNDGGVGTHGDDSSNTNRGVRHYEIYNNTFDGTSSSWYVIIGLRGGTGVIYSNVFSGDYDNGIILYHYCAHTDCGPCGGGWPNPCSYPCSGQIGRGPDTTLDPLYFWNNTYNDGLTLTIQSCTNIGNIIQEDRDFYDNGAKGGYSAYTYPHPLRGEEGNGGGGGSHGGAGILQ